MCEHIEGRVSDFTDWGGERVLIASNPEFLTFVTLTADAAQLTPDEADDVATALHAHAARVRAAGVREVRRG